MTYTPSAELLRTTITALRYVLWCQDHGEWLAAGGHAEDGPPCPVADSDLPGIAAALAALVIGARRAIAEQIGQTEAEIPGFVRAQLLGELELMEVNATFADVDAEMSDGGGQGADS